MAIEVGNKLSGKITSITNFGAFVSLETNQTGLVHISEVSNTYVKDINDILSIGDEVVVKVTSISPEGKIGLSIRQASEQYVEGKNKPNKSFNTQRKNDTAKPERRMPKSFTEAPKKADDFDSLMSAFLKDSDDRLLSLKRNTEGKRGGRGGRRS